MRSTQSIVLSTIVSYLSLTDTHAQCRGRVLRAVLAVFNEFVDK